MGQLIHLYQLIEIDQVMHMYHLRHIPQVVEIEQVAHLHHLNAGLATVSNGTVEPVPN